MKTKISLTFAAGILCCCNAFSQKAILPFGQWSQEPWPATYFYAPNNGDKPADNWADVNFDDSEWDTLNGPISSTNALSYSNTEWESTYAGYWVRREFSINNPSELHNLYVFTTHDDECVMYLNGEQIYYNQNYHSIPNYSTVLLSEKQKDAIQPGKNVLAVYVKDTRGGASFMDFGLYDYKAPPIANPNFDNNANGWVSTGDGFYHGGLSSNRVYRNQSTNPFDVHQSFTDTKKGLYLLKVQAFQMQGAEQDPWSYFGSVPVNASIYLNSSEKTVNNVFDEGVKDKIYTEGNYILSPTNLYFPDYLSNTSIAFSRGMYDNELYAYVDVDSLNVGIHVTEPSGLKAWTCFDNFRLDYLDEADIDELNKTATASLSMPMYKDYKEYVSSFIADYKASKSYEEKCLAVVKNSAYSKETGKSIAQYSKINYLLDSIAAKFGDTKFVSESALEEARNVSAAVKDSVASGLYSLAAADVAINRLSDLAGRLSYRHLTLNITVPGSLGDSILSHVEYFNEINSLKLSGNLNSEDLATIKSRLSLYELDMKDVSMKDWPTDLLRKKQSIRTLVLPESLQSIGEYAFEECINLKSVTFGGNLSSIARYAFYRCVRLENVELPSSLKTIKEYAFCECYSLASLTLPEGLTSIGESSFRHLPNLRSLTTPSTLSVISQYAFYGHNLSEITFNEGLKNIGYQAFECYANTLNRGGVERISLANTLKEVKFPTSLSVIDKNAFAYNYGLENVSFNEGLYQIGDNAFYDCDGLKEVTLPSSLVLCNESPFDYCDNLIDVTCLSIDPPYMTDQIPYGLSMEGRTLHVPALSINTYKQTTGWDKFQTIEPIDIWPENIAVHDNLRFTLPDNISPEFKPSVSLVHDQKGTSYWQYGSLTVNGNGVLSMKDFSMIWDPNYQYRYSDRTQNYCSLVNNSQLRADSVSVQLYSQNNRWIFVSFPYDVKLFDIVPNSDGTTNWVVRRYDGANRAAGETSETWVKLTGNDILNAGEGYIMQSSRYEGNSNQDYSGFRVKALNNANKNNIFRSQDAQVPLSEYLSEFAHNRSWNLIGNPYPCYYDTRFMDFTAPITVWDMNDRTYRAYSPVDDSYVLLPGEAFFVQRPLDVEKITFSKEGRQTNRTARTIEQPARIAAPNADRKVINLALSDDMATDATRIVVNESASLSYEIDKDANKFMSEDKDVPQIYSSCAGVDYSINERPLSDGIVNISFYAPRDGILTLVLQDNVSVTEVLLEDLDNGSVTKLNAETTYVFYSEKGMHNDRLRLHISTEATSVDEVNGDASLPEATFTIGGVKVSNPSEGGIYIKNGKKIIINK